MTERGKKQSLLTKRTSRDGSKMLEAVHSTEHQNENSNEHSVHPSEDSPNEDHSNEPRHVVSPDRVQKKRKLLDGEGTQQDGTQRNGQNIQKEHEPTNGIERTVRRKKPLSVQRFVRREMDDIHVRMDGIADVIQSVNDAVVLLADNQKDDGTPQKVRNRHGSKAKYDKPIDEYKKVMGMHIPHLKDVFNRKEISRSLYNSLIHNILVKCENGDLHIKGLNEVIGGMMFTLGIDKDRSQNESGFGPQALKIRHRALQVTLLNAQLNTFGIFAAQRGGDEAQNTLINAEEKPSMPKWLSPSYFTVELIDASIGRKEGKKRVKVGDKNVATTKNSTFTHRKNIVNGERPNMEDKVNFMMDYAYKALLDLLRSGRADGSSEFWYQLGYVFTDWSSFQKVHVDQASLFMRWKSSNTPVIPWNDIPQTITATSKTDDAEEKNDTMFAEFYEKTTELTLTLEHDCVVNLTGSSEPTRYREGTEVRKRKREVSIVRILALVFRELCFFPSGVPVGEVLSYHGDSIRALYAVARVLRNVLSTRTACAVLPAHGTENNRSGDNVLQDDSNLRARIPRDEIAELDNFMTLMKISKATLENIVQRALQRVPVGDFNKENHVATDQNEQDEIVQPPGKSLAEGLRGNLGM